MNQRMINPGLMEFFEENAKNIAAEMPWMQGKTFKLCGSIAELAQFVDEAIQARVCALDTETTGLSTRMLKNGKPAENLVGLSMCYNTSYGLYIPVRHTEGVEQNLPLKEVLAEVRRLSTGAVLVFHHAKFDLAVLRNHGVHITDFRAIEDTQILTRLYDAGRKETGLKSASEDFLKQRMIEFSEICGGAKRIDFVEPKIATVYAASDAVCTLGLFQLYMASPVIQMQKPIYNTEKRTIFVVMQMEMNMILVDVPYLEGLRTEATKQIGEIKREIHKLVGKEFNIGSPIQLGKILFEDLKYRYPDKKEPGGKWGTDSKVLEKIKDEYPVVAKILRYRGLEKSLGTYIKNLIENHDEDGYVKVGFNQAGTDTGRFSSPGGKGLLEDGYCGINVQSLPSNYDDTVPDLRKAFVARPGFLIVAMDFSGEELRTAANLSREPVWVEAFLNDADLHKRTAQLVYSREEVTKLERSNGKTLNFSMLFGAGPQRVSEQTKASMAEAKKMIASFFAGVPTLHRWLESGKKQARKEKMVQTAFGRVRPLAIYYESGDRGMEAHGDRCVGNTKIQGTCADIMKIVMVRVHSWIYNNGHQDNVRMLLTMHDELVFEIKADMIDYYIPRLNKIMLLEDVLQGILKWPVKFKVDAEYGTSWHVDRNYFEEHPELRDIDEQMDFSGTNQPSGRYALAVEKAKEVPVAEQTSVEVQPQTEATQEAAPVVVEGNSPLPELEDLVSPQETPVEPVIETSTPVEEVAVEVEAAPDRGDGRLRAGAVLTEDTLTYTLRDTRKSTGRLANMIILFLQDEAKTKTPYQGLKRKLTLKDSQGNSFLVSDTLVNPDAFLALARYVGI